MDQELNSANSLKLDTLLIASRFNKPKISQFLIENGFCEHLDISAAFYKAAESCSSFRISNRSKYFNNKNQVRVFNPC